MRVVALLAPLFCACAFQPLLSGTGDHAAQIVRPESGCLQGVYDRRPGRRREYYLMTELRRDGEPVAAGYNTDFGPPLLQATRDNPESRRTASAVRRLSRGSVAALAVGSVLGLGLVVASGIESKAVQPTDADYPYLPTIVAPLFLAGAGIWFGGIFLYDRLQTRAYVRYENLMTTYNKQAEATGCPPLAPTPEPGRE